MPDEQTVRLLGSQTGLKINTILLRTLQKIVVYDLVQLHEVTAVSEELRIEATFGKNNCEWT